MWRPFDRRVAALAAAAAVVLGLSACVDESPSPPPGTGDQYANVGMSATSADHSVAVRDAYLLDPGPDGYQPGSSAALELRLWNNTTENISLVSAVAADGVPVELVGGSGEGTGTAWPTSAAFDVVIPGGGNIPLGQGYGRYLQLTCVSAELPTGAFVAVTFEFSNGATVSANVPVGPELPGGEAKPVPLSPC